MFRAFPYLYDGDEAYERRYLEKFAAHPQSVVVVARDGDEIVGAATATPLKAEHEDFKAPFAGAGYDVDGVFYFAESVLRQGYRGRGVGVRFFEERERHARAMRGLRGPYEWAAFCGVVRPADHPARPEGYVPLDAFWRKRGFAKAEGLTAGFPWKDIGEGEESVKTMQFWIKRLGR
ncbi:MAG: GNAT family N-acetyltransferase [Geminicoccaceae bacterium]|nr:GNAT family N-acetyltransferase [Geminicoccaceae bacterium]